MDWNLPHTHRVEIALDGALHEPPMRDRAHPSVEQLHRDFIAAPGVSRRRRDVHFADTPSPSLLKRLLKADGGAAECLADGYLA